MKYRSANWTQVSGTVTSPADATTMKLELVGTQLSGWLVWDDVSVTLDAQTITKYYYAGSQRVAMRKNGVLNYLLGDHLGSASVVTDAGGSLLSKMLYKPWGETRYTSGVMPTDRLYTGQIAEPNLGLYFYNARWYDPALSRFAQADTIIPQPGNPQSWDRYAYTLNSPLVYTDPSGHRACDGIDCEGSQNPVAEYASETSNIRRVSAKNKVLASQPMIPQLLGGQPQNMSHNSQTIGPLNEPFERTSLAEEFVSGLDTYALFAKYGSQIIGAFEFSANFGVSKWKHIKGPLPAGPLLEFVTGAFLQFSADITDDFLIRDGWDIGRRAFIAGVEDGITEIVSSPVGELLAGLGTACGPGAWACAGVMYFAGSYGTARLMDTEFWGPINQNYDFYRKGYLE